MESKLISSLCLILVLLNSSFIYAADSPQKEPFFTLTLVANPTDFSYQYAYFVADHLEKINIRVDIQLYPTTPPLQSFTWDLLLGEFSTELTDMRSKFTEKGSQNIFGINNNIPYCNESEQLQNQYLIEDNLDIRSQVLNDWCYLLMDNILPLLPLFSSRMYEAIWANTEGYDMRWELSNSLPYMSYNGLHEGQESLDEFNVANLIWNNLNPLLSHDKASDFLIDLISEPILQWSPDNAPLKTGLIDDWDQINDFHYKFYMRDDIFWNPSYNITMNYDDSIPLENSPLMYGIKGQCSDGFNQQVTANDVVFTLLAFANNFTNIHSAKFNWLSDCYVDGGDPLSFHIKIDGDPLTSENDRYNDFFLDLSVPILPEFFLNSTTSALSYTEGGIKCWGIYPEIVDTPQWKDYSKSAFSCGKYLIYYSVDNLLTVLQRNPLWHGIGAIDGVSGKEPFVEKINIKSIPDSAEALSEFKTGKLDLLSVTEFSAERKIMQADPKYEVQTEIEDSYNFLAFNMRRPTIGGSSNYIFLNKTGKEEYTKATAIRKAICYAIDRKVINQVVHDGEYTLNHLPVKWPYGFYPYFDFIKYYRNYDAAWEWMEAAGYIMDTAKTGSTNNMLALLVIFVSSAFFLKHRRRRHRSSTQKFQI